MYKIINKTMITYRINIRTIIFKLVIIIVKIIPINKQFSNKLIKNNNLLRIIIKINPKCNKCKINFKICHQYKCNNISSF